MRNITSYAKFVTIAMNELNKVKIKIMTKLSLTVIVTPRYALADEILHVCRNFVERWRAISIVDKKRPLSAVKTCRQCQPTSRCNFPLNPVSDSTGMGLTIHRAQRSLSIVHGDRSSAHSDRLTLCDGRL